MKTCILFNPRAGAANHTEVALRSLTQDFSCELWPTCPSEDARVLARRAVEERFDRIVVAGGDGTLGQVVNGIAPDFAVELAVLPLGTGNDFARTLMLAPEDLPQACRVAFSDATVAIDVIRICSASTEDTYCLNVANGGFGGRVAQDVQSIDKSRWGPLAYWMTSVTHLSKLTEYRVRMALDDREWTLQTFGVAVANGRYVGGGFPLAPRAYLNDGLLDVTTIPVLPMLELMAAGVNFTLGIEQGDKRIRTYRARSVTVTADPEMPFSIDGEPMTPLTAKFDVLPGRLTIAAGQHPAALARTKRSPTSAPGDDG